MAWLVIVGVMAGVFILSVVVMGRPKRRLGSQATVGHKLHSYAGHGSSWVTGAGVHGQGGGTIVGDADCDPGDAGGFDGGSADCD